MKDQDTFSSLHPVIDFLFFALVLVITMCVQHPAERAISLAAAASYDIYLNGRRAVRFSLLFMLPMMVLAAAVNPAFSHEGVTVVTYLPSGNPLTLESILYGVSSSVMLAGVVLWFACYSTVMTSDKFVYLFGRVIPALSLVLSMTLRFVPKFRDQIRVVGEAQRCIGRDPSTGSVLQRAKKGVTILSIMITWALENAIETADSMKGRGYGLPGRTAFSIYRFDPRDRDTLIWVGLCGFAVLCAWAAGGYYWRYYPSIKGGISGGPGVMFHLLFLALCFTPLTMDIYADLNWKRLYARTAER